MTIHDDMFDKEKRKTIMVSGGFDPVHIGHIRMIIEASKHGDVIVVANSDDWLYRKKGFVFMELEIHFCLSLEKFCYKMRYTM